MADASYAEFLTRPRVSDIIMRREWAMPSPITFTIEPIRELLSHYVTDPTEWYDPFCGVSYLAAFRNDLNPATPCAHHLDAEDWIATFAGIGSVLFDPPYSPRQISECYQAIGLAVSQIETQNGTLYKRVKDAASQRMGVGRWAICCGWNSQGFGVDRGFELVEVLLVAHGGAHNDTIVTVERKVFHQQCFDFTPAATGAVRQL